MTQNTSRACAQGVRIAVYCAVACVLGAGSSIVLPQNLMQPRIASRPNIVVFMTDDQTVESMRVMPKTRALISAKGTTFSNNFVTYPLCCPSRATFLTGQYAHNHGVWGRDSVTGGYHKLDHSNTLPLWLREAGYFTSHIGKYLNGYGHAEASEVPPGWSHWQALVGSSTYRMYEYTINDNGVLIEYGGAKDKYQTDVLAHRAVRTIAEALRAKRPFFLSIAPVAPHSELLSVVKGFPNPRPAPRHLGAFASEGLPLPPSFNEPDVSDKPVSIRDLAPLSSREKWRTIQRYRSGLASLLAVDDLVERVVTKLARASVLKKNFIIFTSDNGFFNGEHRIMFGKFRAYDESVRVPLLIRGGGFPESVIAEQYVANIDLAPTIVRLAGARPRRVTDGRSLLPLALNPELGLGRDLLIETDQYKAVRNPAFLYIEHDTGERELYDMRRRANNYDPFQLESRHADPAYRIFKSRLAERLNKLSICSGITCRARR